MYAEDPGLVSDPSELELVRSRVALQEPWRELIERWFRRESVWTAWMPARRLSTYLPQSSGWSNPVWNLLADEQDLVLVALERLADVAPAAGSRSGQGYAR